MHLGIHYYVLFMNVEIIKLFEGFRDTLIEIHERGFPIRMPDTLKTNPVDKNSSEEAVTPFLQKADEHLHHFHQQEPLKIVIAGTKACLKIFQSISVHSDYIVAGIPGKFDPSPRNLGKIVWYMMRMKLAGTGEKALLELALAKNERKCVSGIQNVWHKVNESKAALLIVENEYSLPGRINPIDQSLILNEEAEIITPIDDIIDIVINKVLEGGGRVVFVENGLLKEYDRIALILHD